MSNVRIQIDLAEDRVRELEEVMRLCGFATKKELFNNALTLLEWAVREVRGGNNIASVNESEKRYRELQMPIFSTAAATGGAADGKESGRREFAIGSE